MKELKESMGTHIVIGENPYTKRRRSCFIHAQEKTEENRLESRILARSTLSYHFLRSVYSGKYITKYSPCIHRFTQNVKTRGQVFFKDTRNVLILMTRASGKSSTQFAKD